MKYRNTLGQVKLAPGQTFVSAGTPRMRAPSTRSEPRLFYQGRRR